MAKKKSKTDKPTFEQSLVELETIVGELERGDLGLAEALSRYEAGVKHLKACYELLQRAERQIELVSGVDADGNPVTEPFDAEADDDLTDQSAARSRKRSSRVGATGARPSRADRVNDGGTLF